MQLILALLIDHNTRFHALLRFLLHDKYTIARYSKQSQVASYEVFHNRRF